MSVPLVPSPSRDEHAAPALSAPAGVLPESAPATPPAPPPAPDRRPRWRRALSALRASLAGEPTDLTTGNLNRSIVLLAIPMVLEMAMESVFAVVDVYFVSKIGKEAVATVGLTESVLTLVYALAIGLAMATTAVVARRVGEGDLVRAAQAARSALGLGLLLGLGLGVPAAFAADDVLALMGASPATIEAGSGYTAVIFGGNVVILLLFLHNAIFRGAGDAAVAMRSLWLANGINIVLDPVLIFGWGPFPELGVTGAAVATTIGRGTGVLYQMHALKHGRSRLTIVGPLFRFDRAEAGSLLRVAAGGIGQLLVATTSWVALMRIMSPFGDEALAGYTIAVRIIMFVLLPAWGLANAAATLVGQNLGARQPERAERAVWLTGAWNMAFLGVVTVLFTTFARPLVQAFTDDPGVVAIGAEALRVMSFGYIFYAWGMVLVQAFNGAGDTETPLRLNLVCFWLVQVPLAYVLAQTLSLGPRGVFWAVLLGESALTVLAALAFRRGRWKTRVV